MKIIFLDIDGVLNSFRSCAAFGAYPWPDRGWDFFDNVAIGLLQRVVEKTNASCVLSSSWRLGMDSEELNQLAGRLGVPIIGKTRDTLRTERRGEQIQDWLDGHPGVTHYVIVDDCGDMLRSQKRFFVKVDPNNGLSYENHIKMIRILEG